MSKQSRNELNEALSGLAAQLPDAVGRMVRWLRGPASAWVRMPLALALIGGGILGFLPILGFWMVPLGLALLAQDVPPLQRPLARLIRWITEKLEKRGGGTSKRD